MTMADHPSPGGGASGSDPGPTLEDGVVRLRPLTPSDAATWHAGEDDEVRRWFQFPRPSTRADVDKAIEAWTRSWSEDGPIHNFGIVAIDSGELIGGVEVRDRGEGKAYLSYQVFPAHRRRGLATRAVRLAAEHALVTMGAKQAVIITDEGNVASRGVAEAAGFRHDGAADPWEHIEIGTMVRYVRP